ncbi:unnamed protein product [Urochloa humidicola]
MGERGGFGAQRGTHGGGRFGGGGRNRYDEFHHYENRGGGRFGGPGRGDFRGGWNPNWQRKYRGSENLNNQNTERGQFDLRQNLNTSKDKEATDKIQEEQGGREAQTREESLHSNIRSNKDTEMVETSDNQKKMEPEKKGDMHRQKAGNCEKCGKYGHKTEECFRPMICARCNKEGHVPRVCTEVMPWEHVAPFCGFAAPGQGFHIIQDDSRGGNCNDKTNLALITVTEGVANARQIENEFKAKAGPNSTWRWYAKKVADNKFQLKFPTSNSVEDLSFFTGMKMRTVPGVTIKVDKWNPHAGAKAELSTAWFRIFNIPMETRTEAKVCLVGSLVGIPLEVDKANLKRWDYVRVKIGCRDISKVPAVVEGLLNFHFYDFIFQREVPVEGVTNTAGNIWTRNLDRTNEDNPSPKKPRWGAAGGDQQGSSTSTQFAAGASGAGQGNQYSGKILADINTQKIDGADGHKKSMVAETEVGDTHLSSKANQHAKGDNSKVNEKLSEGKGKQLDSQEHNSSESSEDQGLRFGNIISPGGEHLSFGTWQHMEIKNLCRMQVDTSKSVVINEYGSNLHKNSFDSLAVIEAKLAMKTGKIPEVQSNKGGGCENTLSREVAEIVPEQTQMHSKENCPSPELGTQEAPVAEWSSQEDLVLNQKQKPREGVEVSTEKEMTEVMSPAWDTLLEEEERTVVQEVEAQKNEEGLVNAESHKTWREAEVQHSRQSSRIKEQGLGDIKIADKAALAAEKKNGGGLQKPEDKMAMETGGEMLKMTALRFHPHEATQEDTGTVLLQ